MKKFIAVLLVAGCTTAVFAQLASSNLVTVTGFVNAAFSWDLTTFDFGKIKVNKPVTHTFTFTNAGQEPLVISSVQASCGCTVTEYSKEPVAPGSDGFVKATYNAAKVGVFTKTVTVNANTGDDAVKLTIKGEVVQ